MEFRSINFYFPMVYSQSIEDLKSKPIGKLLAEAGRSKISAPLIQPIAGSSDRDSVAKEQ